MINYTILVTLPSGLPLFTIEGFTEKDVSTDLIKAKILHHYEWLYGCGNIEITESTFGFILYIKQEKALKELSWTWITSYKND